MSNTQMSLFEGGSIKLPAYLKKLEPDAITKSLTGGSGGKRISIRGSVFRMMVDGKEVSVSEDRAMNIVVVNANNGVSRTFFAGAYVEGEHAQPTCSSDDGKVPRADSEKKQSLTCATCPMNIKGSSSDGKGRACGFNQRLAVVLDGELDGNVYQLNLPSQSIFGDVEDGKLPLQAYAKLLSSHNLPITAVITEMKFDIKSSTPKLTFRAIRALTEEEYNIVAEQGKTDDAMLAVSAAPATLDGAPKGLEESDEEFETEKPKPTETVVEEKPPVKRTKKAEKPAPQEEPESKEEDVKSILAELDEWDD